ncbi:MAG: DUF4258 domain-containing protein [Deltaproteobacteria bacterium]|nr:DUF4258 domain-containing protein [Deltaproteobacteria bacterium]
MKFKLTNHVKQEMERRGIPQPLLENVLEQPQQIVNEYGGKKTYQSKIDFGGGKIYLLRVVVDDTINPTVVITAYRTSKIEKYWRS